jgi:hypothetical protein
VVDATNMGGIGVVNGRDEHVARGVDRHSDR